MIELSGNIEEMATAKRQETDSDHLYPTMTSNTE